MSGAGKEIVSVISAAVVVVGFVEWRVRAAEDEPVKVEKRLAQKIEEKDLHARERAGWFKESHNDLKSQVKGLKSDIDQIDRKLDRVLMSVE